MATLLRKICCFDSVPTFFFRYFILLDLAITHLLGKAPVYIRYHMHRCDMSIQGYGHNVMRYNS